MKIKQKISEKAKNILSCFLFDAAAVTKENKNALLNLKEASLSISGYKIADRPIARLFY